MADGCLHNTTSRAGGATKEERSIVEEMAFKLAKAGEAKSYPEFRKLVNNHADFGPRFDQYLPELWDKAVTRLEKDDPTAFAKIDDSATSYIDFEFPKYASAGEFMAHLEIAAEIAAKKGWSRLRRNQGRSYGDIATGHISAEEALGGKGAVDEALIKRRLELRTELQDRAVDIEKQIKNADRNYESATSEEVRQSIAAQKSDLEIQLGETQETLAFLWAAEAGDASALGRALNNLKQIATIKSMGIPEAVAHTEIFADSGPMEQKLKGGSEEGARRAGKDVRGAKLIEEIMKGEIADAEAKEPPKRKPRTSNRVQVPTALKSSTGVKTLIAAFARIKKEQGAEAAAKIREQFKADIRTQGRAFWEAVGINHNGDPQKALDSIMDKVVSLGIDSFSDAYKVVRDMPALYMSTDYFYKNPDGVTFTNRSHIDAMAQAFEARTGIKVTEAQKAAAREETAKMRESLKPKEQDFYPDIPDRKDVLFQGRTADLALKNLQRNYREPGNTRERHMSTGDELNYLGGYVYERIHRENNAPPAFSEWVSTMKALTGIDIAPKDYNDTWATLKEWSNRKLVRPRIDVKRKALHDASVRMNAAQTQEFARRLEKLDPEDPNFGHQRQVIYDDIMERMPKALEVAREILSVARTISYMNDLSVALTHFPYVVMNPQRFGQMSQIFKSSLGAMARPEVYDAIMAHMRDTTDPNYYYRQKYMRRQLHDVDQKANELFSNNFIHRIAQLSYEGKTSSALSRKLGLKTSVIGKEVPGLLNPEFATKFRHESEALGFIKTTPLDTVKGGTVIGTDINPLAFFARQSAGSERQWNAMANMTRQAMYDAGHDYLKSIGYDPDIHEHAFQSLADTIGIMTGVPNLAENNKPITKFASIIFGAPRFAVSHFQLLGRVPDMLASAAYDKAVASGKVSAEFRNRTEAYLPSNVDIKHTNIHADPLQKVYNSRYVPPAVRADFAKNMVGYLSGVGMLMGFAILSGAEVTLDPRNDNFWRAAYKNWAFGLPGFPIANTFKLLAQIYPGSKGYYKSDGNPQPGLVTPWSGRPGASEFVPYGSKYGGTTPTTKLGRYVTGKLAPGPRLALHATTGYNGVGGKAYWRRFTRESGDFTWNHFLDNLNGTGHDVWGDIGTMSPTDAITVLADKDAEMAEKIWGLSAMLGTPSKTTKFKKDPYYHKE